MLDFVKISTRKTKDYTEVYPKFLVKKPSDLMIRGGDFYAVWVEDRGLWSTDEDDVLRLIDEELITYTEEHGGNFEKPPRILHMWDSDSGMIDKWHKYCQKQMRDSFVPLDEKLIFSNAEVKKNDYATKRLSYPLEPGDVSAYDKLISTLYSEEERHKIEWAIGAIVTGDSKNIQKFMVLYGSAGTGKSTILNIIQQLFEGYYSVFDAKALGSSNSSFALEPFRTNPLVAIQHDGDLSRIEDNTRLNSLVSHELMTVNEKFKSTYATRFNCFLFMGTNKPVKITDAKSGLLRRLIDVSPSGNKLGVKEYHKVVKQIEFELGAIAHHCREVYLSDPGYYDTYMPTSMMGASNEFYNFVMDSYHIFSKQDAVSLKQAWSIYKEYCNDSNTPYPLQKMKFKEELKNYFEEYKDNHILDDGTRVRNCFVGFKGDKFNPIKKDDDEVKTWLKFDSEKSIFDELCKDWPAQYATAKETPSKKWENVKTTLEAIDTSKLHYVKFQDIYHIIIDFDIPDKDGNKSYEKNLQEANKWPPTYAELSKSGAGIHLHYIYKGDVTKLSKIYDEHIEVKVFTGNSSLRRKLTKCNNLPIATISSGLPLKGDKKMVNSEAIKSEKGLRMMIKRNLNKEIHAATKPSVDFIYKILEDAYNSDLHYDVSDMRNAVLAFAASSTNQADYCIKLVNKMEFKSNEASETHGKTDGPIIFYDIEVFPNLFLVNWKKQGEGNPVVRMINPKPAEIEELVQFKLVGFNCRRYDNHLLYARIMGYTNEQLYNLSQKIIGAPKGENSKYMFGEAYNISYTDVYDFAAKKQSLKKWEVELEIHHQELGLPWDQPVPEERWREVAEYCDNDVIATEAVFNHCKGDWTAREILAELAGMPVNSTTNSLTTKIIFGSEKKPALVYTDLATGERTDGTKDIASFPGYEFVYDDTIKKYRNMYRGTDVGFGGYVYAEPGMYGNVALLDVASMHPNSAINLNAFGEYTKNFKDILDARIAIKHKDFDSARDMFDGRLKPYLDDEDTAAALAQALKIAINSVYGLTSAGFDNPFRDNRNKNNIVALRGALFMRTLQDEVQAKGYTVVHIKTDSIKVADADPEIIQFVIDFGKKYGYTFEHEATYERMCLVNNAVYIAKYKGGKHDGEWTATGKEFAVPYIFKSLFTKEDIVFDDLCETFEVKTALYLDMNESLPDVTEYEKELDKLKKEYDDGAYLNVDRYKELEQLISEGHCYHFIGKVGRFCPMIPGAGGGVLLREGKDKDGNVKYGAATGSKGYRWLESEMVYTFKEMRENIDRSYYDNLVDDAIEAISEYGDFNWFVSDEPYEGSQLQLDSICPF